MGLGWEKLWYQVITKHFWQILGCTKQLLSWLSCSLGCNSKPSISAARVLRWTHFNASIKCFQLASSCDAFHNSIISTKQSVELLPLSTSIVFNLALSLSSLKSSIPKSFHFPLALSLTCLFTYLMSGLSTTIEHSVLNLTYTMTWKLLTLLRNYLISHVMHFQHTTAQDYVHISQPLQGTYLPRQRFQLLLLFIVIIIM